MRARSFTFSGRNDAARASSISFATPGSWTAASAEIRPGDVADSLHASTMQPAVTCCGRSSTTQPGYSRKSEPGCPNFSIVALGTVP
jgi:hypothetical protein